MIRTQYFSWASGELPKGCQLCVQGKKLVLFVTGLCSRSCFYCSISDKKYHQDVTFANERPVEGVKDVIEEARINLAEGAGLTGGDSLCQIERTVEYIKALKAEFGSGFHIHLYTTPEGITEAKLQALYDAGLDELRIHPDLNDEKNWGKLALPAMFKWDYGMEIPAIPGLFEQNKRLIDFAKDKISFLNINELEIADNSANTLNKLGFFTKSSSSYATLGSEEAAMRLLKYCEENTKLNVHYCTLKLKDRVQMGNRIKLRAKGACQPFDKVSHEGTLLRGVVYIPGLQPGAKYKERIEAVNNKEVALEKLRGICSHLKESWLDQQMLRAIVSRKELKSKARAIRLLGGIPAYVEEYPTYDAFLIEVDFL
jgi:pyruvate formate-lyase activating enzyme-like uncharacterized protein